MRRFDPRSVEANHFSVRLGMGVGAAIALLLLIWLLTLLLPWLVLTGVGWAGWRWWRRRREFEQRLYACFYECLEAHHGRFSVLDFAMKAQITGPQARSFLDARARDFFADFEPTTYGDILYTFRRTASAADAALPKLPGW